MIAVQNRHRLLVHQGPHDAGLHIDDDALTEPVGLARVMRDHRGDRGLGAGVQSRLRKRHLNRRLTFLAHQVHHSARRPANDIRPLVVFAGALVAEGRYRRVDESRIQLRERVVAEPDRIEVAERKRLDQEVAFRREVGDHRATVGGIEIGGDGFFSGLVCDEVEAAIGPTSSSRNGGMRRVEHPPGGSTLITSAPRSAKILPHIAPFSSVRSSIRKPLSSSEAIVLHSKWRAKYPKSERASLCPKWRSGAARFRIRDRRTSGSGRTVQSAVALVAFSAEGLSARCGRRRSPSHNQRARESPCRGRKEIRACAGSA